MIFQHITFPKIILTVYADDAFLFPRSCSIPDLERETAKWWLDGHLLKDIFQFFSDISLNFTSNKTKCMFMTTTQKKTCLLVSF